MNKAIDYMKHLEIDLFKIILPILITIIMSICGILYADQNKKIDNKVDNVVFEQMIKRMEERDQSYQKELDRQYELNKDQQIANIEMIKILQELRSDMKFLKDK